MLMLTALPALGDQPPLESYHDLLQRPLFTPSRRPSLAPTAARLAGASLRLTGLVTLNGKTIALVRADEQKQETRIGLGASLNGWQVTAIDSHGLDLLAGRQHLRVRLKQAIPPSPE
jgi:hypothetical protein